MSLAFGADAQEVRRRTGSPDQVARVESLVHDDGPARGSRLIRMIGAGGIEVDVLPDRGLDLGLARYRGIPLTWLSPTGFGAPGLVEDDGTRWLRTFGGGLLATCGLQSFGPPSQDGARWYGLHGRIGGIPARIVTAGILDDVLTVRGTVREAEVLGPDLLLDRTLSMPLDGSSLTIRDRIENTGSAAAESMVLYHLNFGWPLLDEHAVLSIPSTSVTPHNEPARSSPLAWSRFAPPSQGAQEQIYRHEYAGAQTGSASIGNPRLGIRAEVTFDTHTLPALFQWRLPGAGHYVLGLEPASVPALGGRALAREHGLLRALQPGAALEHRVTIAVGPYRTEAR